MINKKEKMKKGLILLVWAVLFSVGVFAADVHVYPTDDGATQRSKVEGAVAGDNVLFHPGIYDDAVFRITNSGSPGFPITFKAFDPNNKPVFNFSRLEFYDTPNDIYYAANTWGIGEWPGGDWGAGDGAVSYTGGESWNRGVFVLWRVGYINIEDIEFTGIHCSCGLGAGVTVNAEGGPVNIIRIKVANSDVGIGQRCTYNDGSDLVTISNSEFGWNGRYPNQNPPGQHNIYTSGGTLVMEYCHIHDPIEGQNLHLRNINAIIRYNWIENPYSYMADMSDIRENTVEPDEQVHTYIGNIFVDGKLAESPYTSPNIFVMMEGSQDNVPQTFRFYYNTFIGRDTYETDQDYLLSFAGSSSFTTYLPSLYIYNNIFHNVYGQRFLRNQYTGTYGTRDIQNNWLHGTGTDYSDFSSWMSNNLFGTDPGFVGGKDYSLNSDSDCRDQADSVLGEFPGYEYLHNMEYRIRESVNDLGAYEYISTGPDTTPPSRLNPQPITNLSSGTTNTTISLDTDETATCRYSTTAGTDYPSMTDTFTDTGSTTHSELITGLVDGQTFNYYVKCEDISGNFNTDDFLISFGVDSVSSSCSPADSDTDGNVSINELQSYINQWKTGDISISELMTGIGEWKNGCA